MICNVSMCDAWGCCLCLITLGCGDSWLARQERSLQSGRKASSINPIFC